MFPGYKKYPEGKFSPQGQGGNWQVWCMEGAKLVLESGEWRIWLEANDGKEFQLSFANGAAARTNPGDEFWELLKGIAESHKVEVFPLNFKGAWIPWTGAEGDLQAFDSLTIGRKAA